MFKEGQVIKVNGEKFEITKVTELLPGYVELRGTCEGDLPMLAGKRAIYANELIVVSGGYRYNWTGA